jgi:ABC-type transport system involved in cytochrome bd biosynthesis fused ATPase/permease subunit
MKYGNNKTESEIIDVLKKYNLLSVFSKTSEPSALYTEVLRNGTNISMGMQKVIFLIRGLLKDNTVVFILDEPLTSIDPSTRQNVLNLIHDFTKDRTLLIISHDKEVGTIPGMKTIFIGKDKKEE